MDVFCHFADDGFGEGFGVGGGPDEDVGFDFLDDGEEGFGVFALLPFAVGARVGVLAGGEVFAVGF